MVRLPFIRSIYFMNIRRLSSPPTSGVSPLTSTSPASTLTPVSPLTDTLPTANTTDLPAETTPKDVFLQKGETESEGPQNALGASVPSSEDILPAGIAHIKRLAEHALSPSVRQGVRLEKEQLLNVLRQATQSLSGAKVETATAIHQEFKALAQQLLLGKDHAPQLKTYASLEAAVEAANERNRGAELIVAIKNEDGTPAYAVIELKPGASADEVAAAAAELGPQAEAYMTREDGVITPVKSTDVSLKDQYERVKSLSDMAIADNARGFDVNRTGTQEADRAPAYRANLAMVKQELSETLEAIQHESAAIRLQLTALEHMGQVNTPETQALQARLEELSQQQETLQTADTLITARLLQLPVSQDTIPGTAQRFGEYRNHPEKIQAHLQARIDQIDSRLMVTQDPDLRASLESQKASLLKETVSVSKRQQQHQVAALNTRVRIGALATINKALDATHQRLEKQVKQLTALEARLPHLKGPELAQTQAQIRQLRQSINQDRQSLIQGMEKEIGVYRSHANVRRQGAKDAIDLLEKQVEKLKSLEPGQEQMVLVTVDETRELLLASVKAAGDKFIGITPQEAKALVSLDSKTDDYIADYLGAQVKLEGLSQSVSQKQAVYNDPTVRPSLIGDQQLSALEKAYIKKAQQKILDAKDGDLAKLHELYNALEMANDPKIDKALRDRIDTEAIKAQIAELSQKPEVIKAFEEARKEAVEEVFGKQPVVQELKAHLLSPRYQAYLDLLPEKERVEVLKADLAKLAFADPRAAAEVQQALVGREIQAGSVSILKSVPRDQRTSAFTQVLEKVNTGVDKPAKIADALAKSIDKLTPEEAQKMAVWIKEMQNGNASAGQKLQQLLISKMDGASDSGKAAIGFLKKIGGSTKLGGLLALTAVVAAGGKMPDKFSEADLPALGQFGAASAGAVGNSSAIAKLLGFDADNILSDIKNGVGVAAKADNAADLQRLTRLGRTAKALKVLEVLGPIGDIAGAAFDFYAAKGEFEKGDTFGGSMKVVSGTSGVVAAGASIAILAGATGPAAPLVLVGATVVGLAAWGADEMWGESEQETFLRNLGVLKPA
jgi:hypothetical protein